MIINYEIEPWLRSWVAALATPLVLLAAMSTSDVTMTSTSAVAGRAPEFCENIVLPTKVRDALIEADLPLYLGTVTMPLRSVPMVV